MYCSLTEETKHKKLVGQRVGMWLVVYTPKGSVIPMSSPQYISHKNDFAQA